MTDSSAYDNYVIQTLEIDLDVAECGDILQSHGVTPTADLVTQLWIWAENIRTRGDV